MKTLFLLLVILILSFGCTKQNENIIFCHIIPDISLKKIEVDFIIDGTLQKKSIFLPFGELYEIEKTMTVRWVDTSINGYIKDTQTNHKYYAKFDEYNVYKEMKIKF